MRELRRLGLFLLATQLAACFLPDTADGPTNRCEADADCATGVCNVELGMCVSNARDEPLRVGLRVIPAGAPFTAEPLEVSFPPVLIDGPEQRDLVLPVAVPVSGFVRDSLDGLAVSAQVEFRAQNEIPGRPEVVLAPEVGMSQTQEDYQFNLFANVLPETTYTITVRPTGEDATRLPPLRPASPWMSPGTDESARLPEVLITYPNRCSATVTSECLATIEGIVVDGAGEPQDGYVVRAIETATGRVVSSTATTGMGENEAGRFSAVMDVRYTADLSSWFFRMTPSADRVEELGPQPTFTVEAGSLFGDTVVRIRTPEVARPVTYEGFVEAERDSAILAGATLEFLSNDVADESTGVVGVYQASALSDADGRFSVSLLPGTYDVVVTPDGFSDPELAVLRETIDLTAAAGSETRGQLFRVPTRQHISGTVRAVDGVGMTDAQVRAEVRTGAVELLGLVTASARSNQTMTIAGGRFSMPLDVGVYDLSIVPRAGSNYPRHVEIGVQIGGGDTLLNDRYDLENPMTVAGTASFDAGGTLVPVPGGRIEAYVVVSDGEDGERSVLVAEATIDEEGAYTLLLPPSI